MRTNSKKLFVAVAVAGVVAATGSAFTASNTVADHRVGQGVGTLTGYVTSDVAYTYDSDGTQIQGVTFTLSGSATEVKARVLTGPGTPAYASCLADTDTDDVGPDTAVTNQWRCAVTPVAVSAATGLDVFAADV